MDVCVCVCVSVLDHFLIVMRCHVQVITADMFNVRACVRAFMLNALNFDKYVFVENV